MLIRALPLFAGLAPILGVTAAYVLGARAGVLRECIPLLDGCTSVSSTGRYMPGSLPFRATLFPQAAFLVCLWWIAAAWLRSTGAPRYATTIFVSGVAGAVALILYLTFLGTKAPFYEFMRHFGIYLYFLGTALSQLLFTISLQRSPLRTALLAVVLAPWAVGILNLIQKAVLADSNNIENRIEWWAALLMQVWFLLLYEVWRRDGIEVAVTAGTSPTNERR